MRILESSGNYLLNAFSLQMIDGFPCSVDFEEIDRLLEGLVSAIGHQDTANVLGYPMNRIDVKLHKGDVCYIAQLVGGRLSEGAKTLPEGFSFRYLKATVR